MDTHQQAPEHPPARIRLPVGLTIFVCCVGAFVGGFFGLLAGGFYGDLEGPNWASLGMPTGAGAGLLAGLLWCSWILRVFRLRTPARLTGAGLLAGAVTGCLATAILHTVLIIASGIINPEILLIALICALVSGTLAGGLCGIVSSVVKRGRTSA